MKVKCLVFIVLMILLGCQRDNSMEIVSDSLKKKIDYFITTLEEKSSKDIVVEIYGSSKVEINNVEELEIIETIINENYNPQDNEYYILSMVNSSLSYSNLFNVLYNSFLESFEKNYRGVINYKGYKLYIFGEGEGIFFRGNNDIDIELLREDIVLEEKQEVEQMILHSDLEGGKIEIYSSNRLVFGGESDSEFD